MDCVTLGTQELIFLMPWVNYVSSKHGLSSTLLEWDEK